MRIGEAATASGCHIETIRYYERVGLLPHPARTGGGYRDCRPGEVDRLRFITRGRELGFSLEEIRSLLTLSDDPALSCHDVDQLARHHLWVCPGFPDTEIRWEDDLGGVRWADGDSRQSSSSRRSSW